MIFKGHFSLDALDGLNNGADTEGYQLSLIVYLIQPMLFSHLSSTGRSPNLSAHLSALKDQITPTTDAVLRYVLMCQI